MAAFKVAVRCVHSILVSSIIISAVHSQSLDGKRESINESISNLAINASRKEENGSIAIIASAIEKEGKTISPNSTVFEPSPTIQKGSVVKLNTSKPKKINLQEKIETIENSTRRNPFTHNEDKVPSNTSSLNSTQSPYASKLSVDAQLTAVLDELLENYDIRLRPNFGGKPVVVSIGMWVLSLDAINVLDMDYRMDFFLRQLWVDPRLKHNWNGTLSVSNTMINKLWVPDTYFENSKQSTFHKVTSINKMLSISPGGRVHYNARVTVKASCPMDLRMFPLDKQECALNIESYGYNANHVIYQWENRSDGGIAIDERIRQMPQYNLTRVTTSRYFTMYFAGNWSRIKGVFTLERRTGYFLIHIYAPCSLIVILSWISFCIPSESTAARVTLGVTSVLTITTILNMLNTTMPKVSYVKAIDWYLIGCFLFVFGVLVEYTLVLFIDNVHRKRKRKLKKMLEKSKLEMEHDDQYKRKHAVANGYAPSSYKRKPHGYCSDFEEERYNNHYGFEACNGTPLIAQVDEKNTSKTSSQLVHKNRKTKPLHCFTRFELPESICIDEYSRVVFPLFFVAFTVLYSTIYMQKDIV